MGEYWYAGAIQIGIITIKDVPEGWRKRVLEIIEEREHERTCRQNQKIS